MHQPKPVHVWSSIALLSAAVLVVTRPVQAQAEPVSPAPADAWLAHSLKEQHDMDIFGRYVAAPSSVLLAGGAALLPVAVDSAPSTSIAYISSSALMLTAAIGVWAQSDPYAARRWAAMFGSLGFTAFGTGLALSCFERDGGCSEHAFTRRMQIGVGALEAGVFLSSFITALILPPPSPSALELSVRNLSAPERHARVLDFLERRDQLRRVTAYISAPWGLALGGVLLANAHDAATTQGQVFMYSAGAGLLALNLGLFLYDMLRTPDADRLRAGESP